MSVIDCYLDTLLRRLDGIESIDNVFIILATNHSLNRSLTRAGRLDKVIHFQAPSCEDRRQMLLSIGFDQMRADMVAQRTAGLTYADLSIIPREIEFHQLIGHLDDDTAIRQVINQLRFGRHTSPIHLDEQHRRRTAYHEVGHCLTAYALQGHPKPHQITITPAGGVVGHVQFEQDDLMSAVQTRDDYLRSISCSNHAVSCQSI